MTTTALGATDKAIKFISLMHVSLREEYDIAIALSGIYDITTKDPEVIQEGFYQLQADERVYRKYKASSTGKLDFYFQ